MCKQLSFLAAPNNIYMRGKRGPRFSRIRNYLEIVIVRIT